MDEVTRDTIATMMMKIATTITDTATGTGTMAIMIAVATPTTTAMRCADGTANITIIFHPAWPSGTACLPDWSGRSWFMDTCPSDFGPKCTPVRSNWSARCRLRRQTMRTLLLVATWCC